MPPEIGLSVSSPPLCARCKGFVFDVIFASFYISEFPSVAWDVPQAQGTDLRRGTGNTARARERPREDSLQE